MHSYPVLAFYQSSPLARHSTSELRLHSPMSEEGLEMHFIEEQQQKPDEPSEVPRTPIRKAISREISCIPQLSYSSPITSGRQQRDKGGNPECGSGTPADPPLVGCSYSVGVASGSEQCSSNGGTPSERGGMKSSMRNFSKMVCQKLRERSVTSYNQVAEDLIQEFRLLCDKTDDKNIRRRVYDVLNVLHSMGIIEKDKRELRWVGFPADIMQSPDLFARERSSLQQRVNQLRKQLTDALERYVALTRLMQRNRTTGGRSCQPTQEEPAANGGASDAPNDKLMLPFILISAPKDCRINCEMLEDRSQYFFEFSIGFAIHEDMEILKLLDLNRISRDDLRKLRIPAKVAAQYPEHLVL